VKSLREKLLCPGAGSCIIKMSIVPSGRKPTFLLQWNMSVASREEIIAKVTGIAQRAGGNEGIEVVDVEFLGSGRGRLLRIFIDRPDGVSHSDCEFISQQVGTILDVEDVIPGDSYTLEVSSPGLERKLSRPKDFERFLGQRARVVLREPVDNQRRWEGKLAGFSDGVVALEPNPGKIVHFPLAQIEKANLKFDW
jgi:ribosome maturation factor RimP